MIKPLPKRLIVLKLIVPTAVGMENIVIYRYENTNIAIASDIATCDHINTKLSYHAWIKVAI